MILKLGLAFWKRKRKAKRKKKRKRRIWKKWNNDLPIFMFNNYNYMIEKENIN